MVFDLIRSFFKPSPMDKAFKHCITEADQDLLVTVMTFYESHKAVGTELTLDTNCFDNLQEILRNCSSDSRDLTLLGIGAFLGCVIRENLGGKWKKTPEGTYKITDIGDKNRTIDLKDDLITPLASNQAISIAQVYNNIIASC